MPGLGAGAPAPAAAADKTTFTVALLNEVDSFNPFLGIEAESFEMWALIYDTLVGYSMTDMSPEPALATRWKTSKDGRTWTFTLRDDVTFSDGKPLTSADVAYTYNRVLNGTTESATWGSYLSGVTAVTAPDDTTVVVKLAEPNAVFPLLPIPIIPEHIWRDVDGKEIKSYPAEPKDGEPVVGSGPFRMVAGTSGGSTYRFEANPDYWGGAPHVDEVVFSVYKAEDPAVQALRKGEVDLVEDITPLLVKELQDNDPNITAHNGDSPGFDELSFNAGSVDTKTGEPIGDPNPAVLDPRFRNALGFAIDRDKLVENVYQGGGRPGDSIIPPAYETYRWEPPEDLRFSFDPERAAELLDEAGYTLGPDGKRMLPNGKPIGTLRLFARAESETSVDTMNYVKEWLSQIGIDAEVTAMDSGKLTDVILSGEFDIFQWGWLVEPDPNSMLSYLTCGQRGGWSDSWYCNKSYDDLYQRQRTATSDTRRVEEIQQMQELLYRDAPYLVTAYTTVGEAVRSDRFACLQPQPDPGGVWLIQYGTHNYVSVRPADQAGDCDGVASATRPTEAAAEQGNRSFWLIAGGVALVVLVAGLVMARRRRATVADRE